MMLLAALALALAQAPTPAPAAPAAPSSAAPAAAAGWRALDPENTLVIDTNKGRVVVELAPQVAPKHVERIKALTRRKLYDGLTFFRVIDNFMAQTGDPQNTGEGQSDLPDLAAEFSFKRSAATPLAVVANPSGVEAGFLGALPVISQPAALMALRADGQVTAWAPFCPGVAGMARSSAPDSANSQFFLMRAAYPSLDRNYTVFGRVVSGLEVVRAIKTGEPVEQPQDRMTRVQVMADMPAAERPKLQVMDVRSPAFAAVIDQVRRTRGADFSLCDVDVPTRVQ